MSDTPRRDCKHGHLARSCEICFLEKELAAAEAAAKAEREAVEIVHQACAEALGHDVTLAALPDEISALRHDIERHVGICAKQATEIETLRKQVKVMRETLQFYANPELTEFHGRWNEEYPGGIGYTDEKGYSILDTGFFAKQALATTEPKRGIKHGA